LFFGQPQGRTGTLCEFCVVKPTLLADERVQSRQGECGCGEPTVRQTVAGGAGLVLQFFINVMR
jgi:hypothetical protein